MNKAKALLDSLMGPSRDQSQNEKVGDEFRESNVCKYHLVGCCPDNMLGKKLEANRTEFDRPSIISPQGCTKLHSVALKSEYQQHKDFDRYQKEYEELLLRYLETIVREADGKAVYEKRKREDMQIPWAYHEKLCDLCGLKYKLDKKDGMLGSGLGPESYKEDSHEDTDVHRIYIKLRRKLDELKEKEKAWKTKEQVGDDAAKERAQTKEGVKPKNRDRELRRSRSHAKHDHKSKDSDAKCRHSRDRDRDRDRDRHRSRSRKSSNKNRTDRRRSKSRSADDSTAKQKRSRERDRRHSGSHEQEQIAKRSGRSGRRSKSRRRDSS